MKKFFSLTFVFIMIVLSIVGCDNSKTITLDASKAVNFRCDSYLSTSGESYQLDQSLSVKLFNQCFENKDKAKELNINVNITDGFIDLKFIGDPTDTEALIVDGNASYGTFSIYSNDVVLFKYDTIKKFYQYEDGFYNFINTQILIFK